jgi:hypothetical protein
MKKFKFQKELEKLKDSDFLEGEYFSWSIYIQSNEFSLPKRYLGIGFQSEESANMEMERIKIQYPKSGKELFHIEVRKEKVRRLKKPISLS